MSKDMIENVDLSISKRQPICVTVKDFSYSVNSSHRIYDSCKKKKRKTASLDGKEVSDKHNECILKNINLQVLPGEMLVIMGPSGSGKTTLLNAISGRLLLKNSNTTGCILYNGVAKNKDLKNFSNYVMQKCKLHEFLTVRETLMISASLKMKCATYQEKMRRVDQILLEVSLWKNQNTYVGGSSKKGLSGGEIRRLAIAIELLDNPSILFLDEPTSGLDASLAYNVLLLLIGLSKHSNRTIICTVHQPRSQVFSKFDMLLLLNKGRIVYQGKAKDVAEYFASLGYRCPSTFNLADFILDLLVPKVRHSENSSFNSYGSKEDKEKKKKANIENQIKRKSKEELFPSYSSSASVIIDVAENEDDRIALTLEQIEQLFNHYLCSEMHRNVLKKLQDTEKINTIYSKEMLDLSIDRFIKEHKTAWYGWFVQVYYLTYRASLDSWRNPAFAFAQFTINIVVALILGNFFYQLPNEGLTERTARNILGCLFFQSCNLAFSSMTSLNVFSTQRIIYNRETANNLYYPSAFFVAQCIADAPLQFLPRMIYLCIVYFMCGFEYDANYFFTYFLIGTLIVFTSCSYMYCIGTALPNIDVAQLLAPIIIVIFMLLGGFYLNDNSIPAWISWLKYVSFLRWAYFAFASNQFRLGNKWGNISNEKILELGGVSDTRVALCCFCIFLLGVFFRLLAFLFLKFLNRRVGLES